MLQSIWQDLRQQFRSGNRVTQLILVNVIVFVVMGLLSLVMRGIPGTTFDRSVTEFLSFSKDWVHNLTHPWSIVTYAFLHGGLGHLFWNMILLYWFGRIVGDLIGDHRILPLYLLGAVAGGALFWATAALGLYPSANFIVGASASVMAFIVAAAFIAPDYQVRLLILGEVRLKYLSLAIILIDVLTLGTDANTGGHVAHIGGMLVGYFYVAGMQNGRDLAEPINGGLDRVGDFFGRFAGRRGRRDVAGHRAAPQPAYESARTGSGRGASAPTPDPHELHIDEILDKIKAEGIGSLSPEERETLALASRRGR